MEIPQRHYLMWMAWLDAQWNRPDRRDHYAMQIAQEVRRVLRKNPETVELDHFKIPFVKSSANVEEPAGRTISESAHPKLKSGPPIVTKEMKSEFDRAASKRRWLGAPGGKRN